MVDEQYLQYMRMQNLRQQQLQRYHHIQNLKAELIHTIRAYIQNGGNPATNPDLSAQYFALYDESNGAYFQFESNINTDAVLVPEQQPVDFINN